MALLKCPECKKKFSDKAAACPSCGAPLSLALEAKKKTEKQSKVILAVVAVVVISVVVLFPKGESKIETATAAAPAKPDPQLTEIKLQRLARGFVQSALKDPDSAEFRNQTGVCGEVNAKNGFGGKTGFRRFVAVSNEIVVIDGEALRGSEFQKVWEQACK